MQNLTEQVAELGLDPKSRQKVTAAQTDNNHSETKDVVDNLSNSEGSSNLASPVGKGVSLEESPVSKEVTTPPAAQAQEIQAPNYSLSNSGSKKGKGGYRR